tara:strand:- start:1613 stop:2104 length:492 start_codon:yes stop_codon:yes gene_type:complete
MAQTISSTKNIKGNRKVVVAQYISEMVFKIPDGLDLEDKAIVKDYHVKNGQLWINYVDGRQEECECYCEIETDFKYPHETKIYEPDDLGYTDDIYSDEESDEELVESYKEVLRPIKEIELNDKQKEQYLILKEKIPYWTLFGLRIDEDDNLVLINSVGGSIRC